MGCARRYPKFALSIRGTQILALLRCIKRQSFAGRHTVAQNMIWMRDAQDAARGMAMSIDAAPRLSRHRVIQTRNPDEIGAFLHTRGIRLDVTERDARQLDACLNGVSLPNMTIAYVHYGTRVSVSTTCTNYDYWILPTIRGHLETVTGKSEVVYGPGTALAMSPPRDTIVRSQEASARLSLRLIGTALTRHLAVLLGRQVNVPLELATHLSLAEGYGRSIAGYLYQAIADLESDNSTLCDPITASAFEQFIMTELLMWHPHNYSEALRRLDKPIAPRDVKRAIDYIEEHLDRAVTLADIVAVSGVPGRTLFKHFKDYRGTSPMNYLRTARFQKVRDELRRSEPDDCVAEIAARWGFEHMSRFAAEYRKRFSESPSQTLGKRGPRPERSSHHRLEKPG
jgi:AraC-like DNA-binding protein